MTPVLVLLFFTCIIFAFPKGNSRVFVLFLVILLGPRMAIGNYSPGQRPIELRAEDLFLASSYFHLTFKALISGRIQKPKYLTNVKFLFITILGTIATIHFFLHQSALNSIYLIPLIKSLLLSYLVSTQIESSKFINNYLILLTTLLTVLSCIYFLYQPLFNDYCGEWLWSRFIDLDTFRQLSAAWSGKLNLGRSNIFFEREPAISAFILLFLYAICRIWFARQQSVTYWTVKMVLWTLVFMAILATKSRSALVACIFLLFTPVLYRQKWLISLLMFCFVTFSLLGETVIPIILPLLRTFFTLFPIAYDPGLDSLSIRAHLTSQSMNFNSISSILIGNPMESMIVDNQFVAIFSGFGLIGLTVFLIYLLKFTKSVTLNCEAAQNKIFYDLFVLVMFASLTIEPFRNLRMLPAITVFSFFVHRQIQVRNIYTPNASITRTI